MKSKLPLAALAALLMPAWMLFHGNIPGKTELEVDGGKIAIDYVAPELQGRDVEEEIRKPGANPWRLGADRATTLTTPVDLKFGDGVLPAGRYTLRAYLDDEGAWWLQAYDSSRAVAGKLPLTKSRAEKSEEHLVIELSGSASQGHVSIQWGRHKLDGDFSVA